MFHHLILRIKLLVVIQIRLFLYLSLFSFAVSLVEPNFYSFVSLSYCGNNGTSFVCNTDTEHLKCRILLKLSLRARARVCVLYLCEHVYVYYYNKKLERLHICVPQCEEEWVQTNYHSWLNHCLQFRL